MSVVGVVDDVPPEKQRGEGMSRNTAEKPAKITPAAEKAPQSTPRTATGRMPHQSDLY
jgi:hypothetical protein